VPECHAIVQDDFENNLLPQKRYVLRGEGELQAETGTTTLVRDRNRCIPSPPPAPPSPPPTFPILRMQTRPLYLVSFQATVQTTIEQFNVGAYANRMSTALGTPEVGVTIASGSVVVTTTAGADDQSGADQLVSELTDMAGNADLLSNLYGAPADVDLDSVSITQNPDAVAPPPPSTPPSRSDEDHSYIALIIILAILVPTAAFCLYLRIDQAETQKKKKQQQLPKEKRKTYTTITTAEFAPTTHSSELSFKFYM
jgi:hypothetical protein